MPGGIHMAIAAALCQIVCEGKEHVFVKAGRRMASIREPVKVLAIGVRRLEWVEIIVDGEGEEESVLEQVENILCKE